MRYIAHRGNYKGRDRKRENQKDYILEAYFKGYDVEVDIWSINKRWFLGHDEPLYPIVESEDGTRFLDNSLNFHWRFWFHCKNEEALQRMSYKQGVTAFWHNNDDYVFTSDGRIWTCNVRTKLDNAIVMVNVPEDLKWVSSNVWGICCDVLPEIQREEVCK